MTRGFLFLFALFIVGMPAIPPAAGDQAQSAGIAVTADIDACLYSRDFAGVYALAAAELDSLDVPRERKLALLRATATAHLMEYLASRQDDSREKAIASMKAMLALDASADFTPGHRYPAPVHTLFREVRHAWFSTREAPADPTRVAVAPFYLIDLGGSDRLNWPAFVNALPFLLTDALQAVPHLTLLSREHMETIRAELALATQDDLVSDANRIRFKELLSASSFIYGELQVLPGDEVYLDIRWVQTETGTTLLSRQGKKRIRRGGDLLDLEEEVFVQDFIPTMLNALAIEQADADSKLVREHFKQKMSVAGKGDTYLHYVTSVASATLAEQDGAIETALAHWRAAAETMPSYAAPRERVEALELLSAKVREADQ